MHESVMEFCARHVTESRVVGQLVLEVGSYDVNGGARAAVERLRPVTYVGTDMRRGPGVDVQLSATDLVGHFGLNLFDVVLCTEVLEHVEMWRAAVQAMKLVLRPGGLLVVTTRSRGFPLHDFPADYWRFELEDFAAIFVDMEPLALERDPQVAGVFFAGLKLEHAAPADLASVEPWSMVDGKVHDRTVGT